MQLHHGDEEFPHEALKVHCQWQNFTLLQYVKHALQAFNLVSWLSISFRDEDWEVKVLSPLKLQNIHNYEPISLMPSLILLSSLHYFVNRKDLSNLINFQHSILIIRLRKLMKHLLVHPKAHPLKFYQDLLEQDKWVFYPKLFEDW